MLFVDQLEDNQKLSGKLLATNVHPEDNELEYYRLVGEAYNQHLLSRGVIDSKSLHHFTNETSLFAYIMDGIPQLQQHSHMMDS